MGAYIITLDVPDTANTGDDICPGVLLGNNDNEAVAVGLSWSDEEGPSAIEGITILGAADSGNHETETLHPTVRVMPGDSVTWGVSTWRINEDGITWTKVETRMFTIQNLAAGGGGGGGEEEEDTGGLSTTTKLLLGGLAAVGVLLSALGIVLAKKK